MNFYYDSNLCRCSSIRIQHNIIIIAVYSSYRNILITRREIGENINYYAYNSNIRSIISSRRIYFYFYLFIYFFVLSKSAYIRSDRFFRKRTGLFIFYLLCPVKDIWYWSLVCNILNITNTRLSTVFYPRVLLVLNHNIRCVRLLIDDHSNWQVYCDCVN